jgi:hypothetical protein
MRSLINTIAAAGVVLFSGLAGNAQEVKPTSPELQPLHRFVGSWEIQMVSKPAEWTPEKKTTTCTTKMEWTLGGRMIETRCVWTPDNIHGLALIAYDAVNKEYRQWYFDSTGLIQRGENRGNWDEPTKTFTWKTTSDHGIVSQSHRFIDKDTFEWIFVFKDAAGKVCLDMEGTAKRK